MTPRQRPFDLDALRPADTPAFMAPAWLGCISYALAQPEIWAAFIADTGTRLGAAPTAAAGLTSEQQRVITAFVLWANVRVWGPLDGRREPTTGS
jgi:hypothetical protein